MFRSLRSINFHKVLPILLIGAIAFVVLFPPLHYGYAYPTAGDDTADHLAVIDQMEVGQPLPEFRYSGLAVAGTLKVMSGMESDPFFLWFNYGALIAMAIVLYYFGSRLFNRKAGLLMPLVVILCTPALLSFFQCGTIFSIINTCIFTLLAIMGLALWLRTGRVYHLGITLGLFAIVGLFHLTTSLYALYSVGLFLVLAIGYSIIKSRHTQLRRLLGFTGGFAITSLALPALLLPNFIGLQGTVGTPPPYTSGLPSSLGIGYWATGLFSPIFLALLALGIIMLISLRKRISLPNVPLAMLGCFVVVLSIGAFTRLSGNPDRFGMDLGIIMAVITAAVLGLAMEARKSRLFTGAITGAVILGCIPILLIWFGYTSAVRPADTQAIAYLNSIGNSTYTTSTQVAPWIYERFVDMEYVEGEGDYIVYRDTPMTQRTDPDNYHFTETWGDIEPSQPGDFEGLELLVTFEDGEVIVWIYKGE